MDRVGLAVLRALALGLGQPREHFDRFVLPRGDPHLKIVRYPAPPAGQASDQGVGMHHDSGLVSFVLQDDVGGLQVDSDGGLIEAEPRPGMYVMNLGRVFLSSAARCRVRADRTTAGTRAADARRAERRSARPDLLGFR
jgi:isopenicillin N synthase-like dioxygenase